MKLSQATKSVGYLQAHPHENAALVVFGDLSDTLKVSDRL